MIFLQLFYKFLLIGLFTFGGGYSMIALIEDEVVEQEGWMTREEFTDMLAISQMTPGPVGINTATYAGYASVVAEGYPKTAAIAGALVASLAVLMLPLTLILLVGRWLLAHKEEPPFDRLFPILRLTVVGLIAAAALTLMPPAFSPTPLGTIAVFDYDFSLFNIMIFAAVFVLSAWKRLSPILLILLAGLTGLIVYC